MNKTMAGRLFMFLSLWGVCLILGGATIAWINPAWAALAIALLVLTAALAVTNLIRYAGWGVVVIGLGLVVVAQIATQGLGQTGLVGLGLCAAALLSTALFGSLTSRQVNSMLHQVETDRKMIDDLRMYDPDTELIRFPFGLQNLRLEISRSRRYGKDACLVLVQIANLPEVTQARGIEGVRALQAQIAGLLKNSARDTDVPFADNNRLGAILPETGPEGAQVFSSRLSAGIAQRLRSAVRIGVAHYPADGVSEDEIMHAAEAALQVAQISGEPIVFYTRIRSVPEAPPESNPGAPAATAVPLATSTATPPGGSHNPTETPEAVAPPAGAPSVAAGHAGNVAADAATPRPMTTTPEPAAGSNGNGHPVCETLLRVTGLTQVPQVLCLEKALQELPEIERIQTIEFADGNLILRVFHHSTALVTSLTENQYLALSISRRGANWIEAEWKDGHVIQQP